MEKHNSEIDKLRTLKSSTTGKTNDYISEFESAEMHYMNLIS